jgi:hypothetical protein
MAQHAIERSDRLDAPLILAPERYDPRRHKLSVKRTVADIARTINEQIHPPSGHDAAHYLVLDTGDAYEGAVRTRKPPLLLNQIGSAKKLAKPGDVIISRLRPYLRQVAYIDAGLFKHSDEPFSLACSTEFYVLRSRDTQSIAFLVPYLLSKAVQEILYASQEGGHHPRFNQATIESLSVPDWLLAQRNPLSVAVESAINSIRLASSSLEELVSQCSNHPDHQ